MKKLTTKEKVVGGIATALLIAGTIFGIKKFGKKEVVEEVAETTEK